MFTLEQIKEVHSRVKSGADFPAYAQNMKKLGVVNYIHYLADGQTTYNGTNDYTISGTAKWDARPIAQTADSNKLKADIAEHQAGKSTYLEVCVQLAEAGVHHWVVDLQAMTCIYYDATGGEMLVERIPQ